MTLDILSLIVGAIIWELLSAYIRLAIKPKFKKKGLKDNTNGAANTPNYNNNYNGPNVGVAN